MATVLRNELIQIKTRQYANFIAEGKEYVVLNCFEDDFFTSL